MTRGFCFSLLALTVLALLAGAMFQHYASTARQPSDGLTKNQPAQSPILLNATRENRDPAPAATTEPLTNTRREKSDAPSGAVESFQEWLQKYRAANPDTHLLRDELQAALAELAQDDEDANASDATTAFEALQRAEQTAGNDYTVLLDKAEQFLEAYPSSPQADDVRALFAKYSAAWDEHDFAAAREFSRDYPDRFQSRIARYQEYLERHAVAGQHIADAKLAIESIRPDWVDSDYRAICEFSQRYPNDLSAVAARVRRFVEDHPSSNYRRASDQFLARYEKAAAPGEYRLRVKSGNFARTIGRNLSFGPDLAVEVEVAGIRVGRTPVVKDSFDPVWDYEFPQNIRWRMGDPIKIRVIDFDYSNRTVLKIDPTDDPLALRYLTGTITADGHRLIFESNFDPPSLPSP